MESRAQGTRLWRFLYRVVHPILKYRLGLEAEKLPAERPVSAMAGVTSPTIMSGTRNFTSCENTSLNVLSARMPGAGA